MAALKLTVLSMCFLAAGCGGSTGGVQEHQVKHASGAATTGLNVWQLGYLYTVAPNGDLRLFIRNVFGSDWSPDGTRIAYVSNGNPGAMYVADASGEHRKLILDGHLVHGNLSTVAWSPNGREIAFDAGQSHIYLIRPDGTGLRQITSGHYDEGPAWSPDGKSLAFDRLVGNSVVIYVMRSDGSDQHAVTDGAGPVWSPDGKLLAFESVNGDRVLTVSSTGHDRKVVAHGQNPAWTPDGHLSFTCCVKGYNDGELTDGYEIDLHGGSPVRLVSNLDGATAYLSWRR